MSGEDGQTAFEGAMETVSWWLITVGTISLLAFGCGCSSMLNKDQKRADPTLLEMTIPNDFRITNAPPRFF